MYFVFFCVFCGDKKADDKMKLIELSECGEWLSGGSIDDIVISCRVRLARNLAEFNFIAGLSAEERHAIVDLVRDAVTILPPAEYVDLQKLKPIERMFLLERHLISRELVENKSACGVIFDKSEKLSIMINEEDHLRLQALGSGQRLSEIFAYLSRIDDTLSTALNFSWTEELGYLTACPSNVGTGLRVSAMLHLPALTITRHIEKAFRAAGELHLAVRGYYGEGTKADGDLYQISNQITLGRSEDELIADLIAVVDELANYETRARDFLLSEQKLSLEDRVWRSLTILRNARLMTSDEAMAHLSNLRLGTALKILPPINPQTINRMLLFGQPAHLQIFVGHDLENEQRDALRAELLRNALKDV